MSKNQNTKIIINPLTQRPVKFGTRVYKQLLKDNIIAEDDEDTPTKIKKQIQKIQKGTIMILNQNQNPKHQLYSLLKIKELFYLMTMK